MLAFISLILVIVGSANWFCIGILQYDFVAGLFGSQANVFSRVIYAIIGVASIIMIVNLIKNKGRFKTSFGKMKKEMMEMKEKSEDKKREQVLKQSEYSDQNIPANDINNNKLKKAYEGEYGLDYSKSHIHESDSGYED